MLLIGVGSYVDFEEFKYIVLLERNVFSVYDYSFLYKFCYVILRRMCVGKYYVFFYIYQSYYILKFYINMMLFDGEYKCVLCIFVFVGRYM